MSTPLQTPLCLHCNYDITGRRVEDICPECGRRIWAPELMERKVRSYTSSRAVKLSKWACLLLILPAAAALLFFLFPLYAILIFCLAGAGIVSAVHALGEIKSGLLPRYERGQAIWAIGLALCALIVCGFVLTLFLLSQ